MFKSAKGTLAVIIDSDEEFRTTVNDLLFADFGFKNVLEADDFESAAARIPRTGQIDLGVFDVTRMLAQDPPAESLPISIGNLTRWIGVLGAGDEPITCRCLDLGARGIIRRDFRRYELRRALDLVLGGWTYLPPGTEFRTGKSAPSFIEAEMRFLRKFGT